MWVNISGLSIVFGGMSALDTLCSQAYGARNFKLVGLWAQRCIVIILMLRCDMHWQISTYCMTCLCQYNAETGLCNCSVPIFFLWYVKVPYNSSNKGCSQ